MPNSKLDFILASGSPRRKELIGHLQIPFKIITSNIPEESSHSAPEKFCLDIAQQKGEAVYRDLKQDNIFVLSADTIVSLGPKIYGKPTDLAEAGQFLKELSGKTHEVFTGVSVLMRYQGQEQSFSFVEKTSVTFNTISSGLLKTYLATKDSMDKAGAYGIQGGSLAFISRVEGDYANVVGFPLSRFVVETEAFLKKTFQAEDIWDYCFRS